MKLREYIDDTEDYINIILDDKENHLLQMGAMLTTATLFFVVVAGIFGMNINIELFNDELHGMTRFLWTVGGSTAGVVSLSVIAIAWCKCLVQIQTAAGLRCFCHYLLKLKL